MATVFLNGRLVSGEEARVSALDAGLQHAVGLFETMSARAKGGVAEVAFLERHVDRLIASAAQLGLTASLRKQALDGRARSRCHAPNSADWRSICHGKPSARRAYSCTLTNK